jgi:hypothetical protein
MELDTFWRNNKSDITSETERAARTAFGMDGDRVVADDEAAVVTLLGQGQGASKHTRLRIIMRTKRSGRSDDNFNMVTTASTRSMLEDGTTGMEEWIWMELYGRNGMEGWI